MRQPVNRAVFLDRDGVINRVTLRAGKPHPPATLEELDFLPGVAEAIDSLRGAGFRIIVTTNQPDVATGIQQRAVVEAINQRIQEAFLIDDIRVCYHAEEDGCSCRKPKPGMLLDAKARWSLDLDRSFMVGDRWRDVDAGKAAGCRTILVDGGYNERKADNPDAVVKSLLEACALILNDRL